MLLTLVVRKDASQILSWTDGQNQTGLTNVLSVIGRVLTPSEHDTGGLVVGDLIIHLLRNSGDSIVPSLPDLIRALVNRMTTAKTVTLSQVCSVCSSPLLHFDEMKWLFFFFRVLLPPWLS